MDVKACVQRGNLTACDYRQDDAGRYIGNGCFGAVLDGLGLNRPPLPSTQEEKLGKSQFNHMAHWGRFRFVSPATQQETTADYLLPLFKLHWRFAPEDISHCFQEQDLYDGVVHTSFTTKAGEEVSLSTWADWEDKDLICIRLQVASGHPCVYLTVADGFIPYAYLYREHTQQHHQVFQADGQWKVDICCTEAINGCASTIYLHTDAPACTTEAGMCIRLAPGQHHICLSYGRPVQTSCETSLSRSCAAWHGLWEKSGLFDFSNDQAQQMYIRSLAYLLSSYGDDSDALQPTSGLTGNMFPFHFVQDMEYIAPALLMTGHGAIVRRWVEKFAGQIEDMQQYAQRLWPTVQGIYPPWELPLGSIRGYHEPAFPVAYCYEPHNVGYLCRMACEAAAEYGSVSWTKTFALPLIRECAAFYRSAAFHGKDGRWHLKWFPSIGQDEAGGRNQQDYLCSLYSAQYCFQAAIRYGLDTEGEYTRILADGLAFDKLLAEDGISHTALAVDDRGKQKHPVQLDGVSFMPIHQRPQPAEIAAYQHRYELTKEASAPHFFGWTLGQFLLSSANMGSVQEWLTDWAMLQPSRYVDPQWVQIHESSATPDKAFYITTHGMVLQALIRLYVNDYWGQLTLAGCPAWGKVSFRQIHTRLGVMVSGTASAEGCACTITALQDCLLPTEKGELPLRKGETYQVYNGSIR